MTDIQAADILREYNQWRRNVYMVGQKVRLRSDNELHTITRYDEYDYQCPIQVDGKTWVSYDDLAQPSPIDVTRAIEHAIIKLTP